MVGELPMLGVHSQYGLDRHFGVDELFGGGAIVFNGIDGCIWERLEARKNTNGYDFSFDQAHKLCRIWNGDLVVDAAAIDGTP